MFTAYLAVTCWVGSMFLKLDGESLLCKQFNKTKLRVLERECFTVQFCICTICTILMHILLIKLINCFNAEITMTGFFYIIKINL